MEIEINCPHYGQYKIKSNLNTTSDTRSLDMKIDYKLPQSKWESINLNKKITYNLNDFKIGKKLKITDFKYTIELYGQFNSTQFPKYNSQISCYMYSSLYDRKAELTIQWNEDYRDKIRYSKTTKMDFLYLPPFIKTISEEVVVFEATPFDINYELKGKTNMAIGKGEIQLLTIDLVGKDVKGREDMEIKGHLQYEGTDSPLTATINSTLKYPGRELFFWSTVKEIKDLTYVGTIKYQLQEGRIVTIVYNQRFVLKSFSNAPQMIKSKLRAFFISKNILSYISLLKMLLIQVFES
jgi:hypothetical protein